MASKKWKMMPLTCVFVNLLNIKAALAVNGTFFSCPKLTYMKNKQNNRFSGVSFASR